MSFLIVWRLSLSYCLPLSSNMRILMAVWVYYFIIPILDLIETVMEGHVFAMGNSPYFVAFTFPAQNTVGFVH